MQNAILQLFIVLIILDIAELVLSGIWNKFYFNKGIPIYKVKYQLVQKENLKSLYPSLEYAFKSNKKLLKFKCHKFNEGIIGFREKMFDFGIGFKYSPLMHGLIRFNAITMEIEIDGYLNWFLPIFFMLWYILIWQILFPFSNDSTKLVFGIFATVFPVLITISLYLVQKNKYKEIESIIKSKLSIL